MRKAHTKNDMFNFFCAELSFSLQPLHTKRFAEIKNTTCFQILMSIKRILLIAQWRAFCGWKIYWLPAILYHLPCWHLPTAATSKCVRWPVYTTPTAWVSFVIHLSCMLQGDFFLPIRNCISPSTGCWIFIIEHGLWEVKVGFYTSQSVG